MKRNLQTMGRIFSDIVSHKIFVFTCFALRSSKAKDHNLLQNITNLTPQPEVTSETGDDKRGREETGREKKKQKKNKTNNNHDKGCNEMCSNNLNPHMAIHKYKVLVTICRFPRWHAILKLDLFI